MGFSKVPVFLCHPVYTHKDAYMRFQSTSISRWIPALEVTGEIKYLLRKLQFYSIFLPGHNSLPFLCCSRNRFRTLLTNGTAKSDDALSQHTTQTVFCATLQRHPLKRNINLYAAIQYYVEEMDTKCIVMN